MLIASSSGTLPPLEYLTIGTSAHLDLIANISIAKRLPYSDQIIALDSTGRIAEEGQFDDLNALGGYISGFTLPPADWTYKPNEEEDDNMEQSITKYEFKHSDPLANKENADAEANRRFGDLSIYLYYIRSIGWTPTIIFIVCITLFIFCQSFPSQTLFSVDPHRMKILTTWCRYLGQMVGSAQRRVS